MVSSKRYDIKLKKSAVKNSKMLKKLLNKLFESERKEENRRVCLQYTQENNLPCLIRGDYTYCNDCPLINMCTFDEKET